MAILDAYGNPVKLGAKPKRGYGVSYKASSREYDYTTRTLTPAGLWAAAVNADNGDTSALQTYFEKAFRHDAKLYNLDQRRRSAIAGLEWEWRPYVNEDDEDYQDSDGENCKLVGDIFNRIPRIQDHVKGICGAIPCGFSVWDINWMDGLGGTLRPYLRTMPQRLYTFCVQDQEEIITSDWPNVLTDDNTVYGEPLAPEKTIVAVYQDAPEVWHCGIMQSVIWYWLRKRQLWGQLMATGERFAEPIPVGYYGMDEENGQLEGEVLDAQEAYGPGAVLAVPGTGEPLKYGPDGKVRGAYLDLKQPDLKIPAGFWEMSLEQCDREMAIAFTSGNLLTDTTGGTGTYSAQKGQRAAEKEDLRAHDADWLQMGAVRDLARLILLFNKGEEAAERLPRFTCPGLEEPENLELRSSVIKTLGETNWDNLRAMPDELKESFELPEFEDSEPQEPDGAPPAPNAPPVPNEPPEDEEEPEELVQACDHFTAAVDPGIEQIKQDIASLVAKAEPFNEQAAAQVEDRVTAYLLRMKRPPKTAKAFQKTVLRHIDANYEALGAELDHAGMGEWFEETYKKYKTTDRSVWPGEPPKVAISFGAKDIRSAKHMADQAYWHFSKFTDNETFRKPMQDFLKKTYMDEGAQVFSRNKDVVEKFAKKLGKTTKDLADHEIDRIARTSVARAREQSRIMQMADAGVDRAVVITHPDACPVCTKYKGQTIDVKTEVQYMAHLETLDGDEYHEALRAHSKQAAKGVPPHEFQDAGGGSPLYHPNCRCGVDMYEGESVPTFEPGPPEPTPSAPASKEKPANKGKPAGKAKPGTEPVTIRKGDKQKGYKIPDKS